MVSLEHLDLQGVFVHLDLGYAESTKIWLSAFRSSKSLREKSKRRDYGRVKPLTNLIQE